MHLRILIQTYNVHIPDGRIAPKENMGLVEHKSIIPMLEVLVVVSNEKVILFLREFLHLVLQVTTQFILYL